LVTVLGSDGQGSGYVLEQRKGKVRRGNLLRGSSADTVRDLLAKSLTNFYPFVEYQYSTHSKAFSTLFSMTKVHTPDGKFLEVKYDDHKRVKELTTSGQNLPIYTFDYHTNYTDVIDAKGAKKRFEFSKRRLIQLSEPQRRQKFDWDEKGQLKMEIL
jgi:YD repeat-containing protein